MKYTSVLLKQIGRVCKFKRSMLFVLGGSPFSGEIIAISQKNGYVVDSIELNE